MQNLIDAQDILSKAPKLYSKIKGATALNFMISQSQTDPLNSKMKTKR